MPDDELRRLIARSATRRALLKRAGAAGLAAMGAPLARAKARTGRATLVQTQPTRNIAGTSLSILQWSHFVPQFDEWFEPFLNEWGEANQVEVRLDRVNTAEVPGNITTEVGAQQGHDIVEHIASLPQFEPAMLDLSDVVQEATARHGPQLEMARSNSFNPTTGVHYGFCHGYAPDPANYRRSLWEQVELPNGPTTFDELLDGGSRIRSEQGIQLGIGMSNEIDSNMAAQAMMWAFGGSIQDENENVTINSPENIAAVEYMTRLFQGAMTPEVFGWNAASNNQLMVAGQASYILNSISAYRTAQGQLPEVANDIFFSTPLVGPAGPERALAHGHAVFISMIPKYSQNQDTAKEFLLHLVANYAEVANQSQLYNFPAFPGSVPGLTAEGGPLDNDPYGSQPPNKLGILKTAEQWTRNLGWPGPANAAIGEVFGTNVLPTMMARAAQGQMTPQQTVEEAERAVRPIFDRWRGEGLIGGGQ
ncbi:MAG: extracellular solute-binding protein [Chloroflexota bacterium]|nr:extracellular solute-binding protein [Chloroflexota bacterium]